MLDMLRDLIDHKNYANAALLNAIAENDQASADTELRDLLHHIILANRFWIALLADQPFDVNKESRVPESLQAIAALYRETHEREVQWISCLQNPDVDRKVVTPFIPDRSFSLAQAVMQVCLHSHGHRAQCTAKLRALGGNPPPMDFIAWLKDRPAPAS
jgi:uncharacterized damage-inducible protein DinB